MKRKAKFRVGQRVMINKLKGIVTRHFGNPSTGSYVSVAGFEIPVYYDEMRPLTKREEKRNG